MEERDYWLGFSVFPGVGPKRFSDLLERFGSAETAWNAPYEDMKTVIGEAFAKKFDAFKKSFSFDEYQERLAKKDVSFLILADENYPRLLKQITNPPFMLYVKGDASVFGYPGRSETTDQPAGRQGRISKNRDSIASLQNDNTIGIVGTRKITSYGKAVTEMITADLVNAGFVIVSGLAMGVDTVAHKTTIDNGGKTIAVLGCGVDCCTPATNQSLYNSIIASGGAIVSEFPLSQIPTKGSFPSRNRIIAGLSEAIVVTEGAEDSGALITAEDALKNKRKVFAVPGPITSQLSKGPNKLLSNGASLVTSAEDILKEMGIKGTKSIKSIKSIKGETEEEQKIIDLLENEPLHFDDIVKKSGFTSPQISILLSMMEMKDMIENSEEGYQLVQ